MASVSTDSRGRVYLRGPNGRFATPTTNEEHKMIEKARKQIAKENKSRVSGVSRTEPTGKEKLSNKREQSKFAASHGPKSSAKSGRSTSGRFAVSDSKALTRSKSLSVTNADSGYEDSRSKSKRRPVKSAKKSVSEEQSSKLKSVSAPKRRGRPAKKSVSEEQSSKANSIAAPKRRGRPAKSAKKSMNEDQSSKAKSVSAPKRRGRSAKSTKKSVSEDQNSKAKSVSAPNRRGRPAKSAKKSVSEKQQSKRLVHSNSASEASQHSQAKSVSAPRRSARLAKSGKNSVSEESSQAKSTVAPRRSARLAALVSALKTPIKRLKSKAAKRPSNNTKSKSSIRSVTDENQNIASKSAVAPRRSARLAESSNKRRSSSTKRKPSIRLDSISEETKSTRSKSTAVPKRNARLAELEKSRRSKTSAKRGQMEAAKLLSFSDSVSDGESNSPHVKLSVAPRRSARLAAKTRGY